MADELLFSAFGIDSNNTSTSPTQFDTFSESLGSSPAPSSFFSDYETPCTPSSGTSEFIENLEYPTANVQDFYTDSLNSPEVQWNDYWSTTTTTTNTNTFSSIGIFFINFLFWKIFINFFLQDINDLVTDLNLWTDDEWNTGLSMRTPLCSLNCEDFLNLPLPKDIQPQTQLLQQQQLQHHQTQLEDPLLVFGVDHKPLDVNFNMVQGKKEKNFKNKQK